MSTWRGTGAAEGMVADFPLSIGDQSWRVWTCCREDPSGTGKKKVARTLDECLSRASSMEAGALWCLVAVRTGGDGTNTVAAGNGVEWTSTMAAWNSVTTIELIVTTVESVRDSKSERTSFLNDTIVRVKL